MTPVADKKTHTRKSKQEMSDTDRFRIMLQKTMPAPGIVDDDTSKYLITVVSVLLLGIVGFAIILWLRPDYDPLLVAGIIFAFLTPTTTSLLSYIKSEEAKKQAVETHLSVNSRLDAFIKQAELAARAEGVQAGRVIAEDRADVVRAAERKRVELVDSGPPSMTGTALTGTITGTIEGSVEPQKDDE